MRKLIIDKMIITVDGFSGSGKSTLVDKLEREFDFIRVIKADDFFYKPGERRDKLSGNFNVKRFIKEVIPKLYSGDGFFIKAYCCRTGKYYLKEIKSGKITIVEGSYSSTRELDKYRDLGIFINTRKNIREKRVKRREKNNYAIFLNKWFKNERDFQIKFKTYKDNILVQNYDELRHILCGKKF